MHISYRLCPSGWSIPFLQRRASKMSMISRVRDMFKPFLSAFIKYVRPTLVKNTNSASTNLESHSVRNKCHLQFVRFTNNSLGICHLLLVTSMLCKNSTDGIVARLSPRSKRALTIIFRALPSYCAPLATLQLL